MTYSTNNTRGLLNYKFTNKREREKQGQLIHLVQIYTTSTTYSTTYEQLGIKETNIININLVAYLHIYSCKVDNNKKHQQENIRETL